MCINPHIHTSVAVERSPRHIIRLGKEANSEIVPTEGSPLRG